MQAVEQTLRQKTINADKTATVAALKAEREAILAELAGMQLQPDYNYVV